MKPDNNNDRTKSVRQRPNTDLAAHYDRIGIKAVAAAVESGSSKHPDQMSTDPTGQRGN